MFLIGQRQQFSFQTLLLSKFDLRDIFYHYLLEYINFLTCFTFVCFYRRVIKLFIIVMIMITIVII